MEINQYGEVSFTENEIFDFMYSGKIKNIKDVFANDNSNETFNKSLKSNNDSFGEISNIQNKNISVKEFDQLNQKNWFMPEEYKTFDIEQYLFEICPQENYNRVKEELILFKKHNMLDLLNYLKYLVDIMQQNSVVWGVGRGSSVASYVLFLLGVHKIDSIKYSLEISEFLK